ncbi:MAG: sensor histidine kinase [Minisyncoccota bacterium]
MISPELHIPGLYVMIAGSIAIFSALYIAVHDRRHASSTAFVCVAVAVGLWALSLGVALYPENTLFTFSANTIVLITILIPPLVFLFSSSITSEHALVTKFTVISVYIPMMIASVLVALPSTLFDSSAQSFLSLHLPAMDSVGGIYGSVYFLASGYILVEKYLRSAGVFRMSLRFFAMIGGVVAVAFFTIMYVYHGYLSLQALSVMAITASSAVVVAGVVLARYHSLPVRLYSVEVFIATALLVLTLETALTRDLFSAAVSLFTTILIAIIGISLTRSIQRDTRDRQELDRLHKELLRAHRTLEELDTEKSSLVSIASHHLRDPLTVIKGYASMLLEGSFGELSVALREALERILQSSQRLIKIVDDFLDVARIESGEMLYANEVFDLRTLVMDLVRELSALAVRAGLTLTVSVDPLHRHIPIAGDEGKIRQVISNLIDNAIKYNISGGTIAVTLGVIRKNSKTFAQLLVTDTGIGLARVDFDHLFKKFGRAQGVSKIYTEGSGLGLYLAREILKRHRGRIWAESAGAGKGTVFYVEIPIA